MKKTSEMLGGRWSISRNLEGAVYKERALENWRFAGFWNLKQLKPGAFLLRVTTEAEQSGRQARLGFQAILPIAHDDNL